MLNFVKCVGKFESFNTRLIATNLVMWKVQILRTIQRNRNTKYLWKCCVIQCFPAIRHARLQMRCQQNKASHTKVHARQLRRLWGKALWFRPKSQGIVKGTLTAHSTRRMVSSKAGLAVTWSVIAVFAGFTMMSAIGEFTFSGVEGHVFGDKCSCGTLFLKAAYDSVRISDNYCYWKSVQRGVVARKCFCRGNWRENRQRASDIFVSPKFRLFYFYFLSYSLFLWGLRQLW